MKNILSGFFLIILISCQTSEKLKPKVVFSLLETNTNASLRGLHVVDENTVWASGSSGTVLLSADGGESWERKSIVGAKGNDFRSIHAWDEKRAMVFGVSGPEFGYKTIDGGENWEVVYRDTTQGLFFNSLKFANDLVGLAVSDPFGGKLFVIRTEDGGESWSRVLEIPDVEEGEANFAASNTCIEFLPSGKAWIGTGGMAARVFFSEDFGKTWEVRKTPMIRGLASSGIFSVCFKTDEVGMVVGGIYDQPEFDSNIAAYTLDGGQNWLPAETMPNEYRSCVQQLVFGEETFAFAIGKTGCDISFDHGMNWQFVDTTGFYTFRVVPGKPEGFVAGADGKVAKVTFESR